MSRAGGSVVALAVAAAAIPLTAFGTRAAGDRALGEYLSSECVTCHQLTGRQQGIPSIIGTPEAKIVEALNEYKSKKRDNTVMQTIAAKFSNDEIAALATYFGSLKSRN